MPLDAVERAFYVRVGISGRELDAAGGSPTALQELVRVKVELGLQALRDLMARELDRAAEAALGWPVAAAGEAVVVGMLPRRSSSGPPPESLAPDYDPPSPHPARDAS